MLSHFAENAYWPNFLQEAAAYNSSVHSKTGFTPIPVGTRDPDENRGRGQVRLPEPEESLLQAP